MNGSFMQGLTGRMHTLQRILQFIELTKNWD